MNEEALPPVPLACLICDQVLTDENTKKKSLIGVFDHIWVGEFPTQHGPIALYARFYDAQGDYDVRVEYLKVDDQSVLGDASGNIHVAERDQTVEFAINLPSVEIPEPGKYEFRVHLNGQYFQSARFNAISREDSA